MDSGMGWSWNAVKCIISGSFCFDIFMIVNCFLSGHVSCQGHPVWCPSPPISEGARVDLPDKERYPQGSEVTVACQRGLTGDPGQSVTTRWHIVRFSSFAHNIWIRCHHGFWTDYSLVCTPAECDKLTETESLSVVYLSNSTDFDSQAELTVTCKDEDVTLKEILTCKEVVNSVLDK